MTISNGSPFRNANKTKDRRIEEKKTKREYIEATSEGEKFIPHAAVAAVAGWIWMGLCGR